MLLRAICALVLLSILVAGLWPFHAPRNEVSWLSQREGLVFERYGSIVSAHPFNASPRRADTSSALEIWLKPRRVRSSGTILAFYHPESQEVTTFALRQSLGDLVLQRVTQELGQKTKRVKIYVDDLFSYQMPVLVTISSNLSGTTVFADGAFVGKFENFTLSSQDLAGRLVVGNSPVTTDDWSGQLKGLAIYNRELTSDEVSQHFANWTNRRDPELSRTEGAVAIYLFNEGTGAVVHNQADSATDLLIPEHFFVLHEQFLERPWNEFRPDWNYLTDIGINVVGFIPLGFFVCAYFSQLQSTEHPEAITVAFGFGVSLTIEVSQAFLPTRDSGMTDLITNTLGTAVGVIVFRHDAVRAIFRAVPIGTCAERVLYPDR